jgi:hypothetical protein
LNGDHKEALKYMHMAIGAQMGKAKNPVELSNLWNVAAQMFANLKL